MISARLNGGLGNCMFQIAATYALALEYGDECAFDFSVVPVYQGMPAITYRDNVFKKLHSLPSDWKPKAVYHEGTLDYQPIPYYEGLLLLGYFQREKYFMRCSSAIKELFKDEDIIATLKDRYAAVLTNSVSIHVRRGDYLIFNKVHPVQNKSYYDRAIKRIETTNVVDNILVFSDDLQWCYDNFDDPRITFIDVLKDYEDMYLMGLCDANIIANSSFSYWGSWLGETEGKKIITPSRWFSDKSLSTHEITPSRWITI